jgi:Uma2 family endonuclease
MTAEEFYEWVNRPENAGKHYELERGRAVEVSRPGELHGIVCHNVDYVLGTYIRRRQRGFVCINDTGIIWERRPDIVRGPDLLFYDQKRRYRDFNPRYSDEVLALVVEVISPNDKPNKVLRRITQFLGWGVKLAWVIDPEEQTVAVYRADRAPEVYEAHQELTGGDTLPEFRCQIAEFFFSTGEEPEEAGPSDDSSS